MAKLTKAQRAALATIVKAANKHQPCFKVAFRMPTLSVLLNHNPPLARLDTHPLALHGVVKPTDAGRAALKEASDAISD